MCEFLRVIEVVFNNWTSLKLCIEHGMGGDPNTVSHKLRNMIETTHGVLAKGEFYDLVDTLEDILDTDFDTELQDNSAPEVATVLFELHKGWHEGRRDEVNEQLRQMKFPTSILEGRPGVGSMDTDPPRPRKLRDPPPPPTDMDADEYVSQDPEAESWTVVSRKK
uniref:Pre-rRNA-processing protein TSR2 homolog n=1 Tax=Lygus hesperus TaxID=30085 RepID=A0A0A9ZDL9_LYGHE